MCKFSVFSQRDAASGNAVTATISDAMTAIEMVSARSANNCDTASRMNTMGRKTITAVTVLASSAGHTWRAPASVASTRPRPLSRCCAMASSMTMAVSSDWPTPKASPASEITFSVRPKAYSITSVTVRQMGIDRPTSSVARRSRTKYQSTATASRMPANRLPVTMSMAWSMNTDGSNDCAIDKPSRFNSFSRIDSISRFTAVSVSRTLASFSFMICTPMAGLPFCSTESVRSPRRTCTSATSPRRTGRPSRHSMTRSAN